MDLGWFYRGKAWRGLLDVLKIERLTDEGQLICEHCGKPIVRKYDCIGHHKIELNEDNVNNPEIALNPNNVMLIHFRCHNLIHTRYEGFRQRVYLVYGSPCSGKTSYVDSIANADDLILDVDRIWSAVCKAGMYNKDNGKSARPNRLKQNVFGIRDCILDQIRTRKGMWKNAFVIGGYPLKTERERLIDRLGAEPIYVEATKEECLTRAETERPEAWREFIENWFESFTP